MSIFKLQHGMAGHKMVLRRRNMRKRMSAWVKSRHQGLSARCPLYPQKRTLNLGRVMSALCQKRTRALQQIPGLAMIRLASRQAKGRTVATAVASASLPVLSRASCCAPPPRPR
jgi:hypothetical protein